MLKLFMPKQPSFAKEFQELQACITDISRLLQAFVVHFNESESYYTKAKIVEQRADDITHSIIKELNSAFITPFDREDIYVMAQSMDDVVDMLEDFFQEVFLYQVVEKRPVVDQFARLIGQAEKELNALVLVCFSERKLTQLVINRIVRLHELENDGDEVYRQAIRQLFSTERDPILLIKWQELIKTLETVMDKYQHVSNTIENIIVKSS